MKTGRPCVAGALLLLAVALVGCKSKPDWVTRGAPDDAKPDQLYAVGVSGSEMNERMQHTTARSRAVVALAGNIDTYVAAMSKDFMQSHKDFAAPENSSSIQFFQSVSKSIVATEVQGASELNTWRDPKSGEQWVLMSVDKSAVNAHMAKKAEERARALEKLAKEKEAKKEITPQQAEKLKKDTDGALKDLQGYLAKKGAEAK